MAKKADATGWAGSPLPAEMGSGTATGAHGATRPTKLIPSALLDNRVVYCGGPCRTGLELWNPI